MDTELQTFKRQYIANSEIAYPKGLQAIYEMSLGEVIADILHYLLLKDQGFWIHDVRGILSQMDEYGLETFAIEVRSLCDTEFGS